MENYKVKVSSEAESKEVQGLFFELGGCWATCGRSYNDMVELGDYVFLTDSSMLNYGLGIGKEEITIPQLKDMVVLKRNDPKDENVYQDGDVPCLYELYLTSDKNLYFFSCGKGWKLSAINDDDDYRKLLKPITKEPIMKEFLNKLEDGTYKLVLLDSVADGVEGLIEVPDGADTLAGDSSTRYFWKHGVGEKGNMIIDVGESLTRYSGWTDCKDSADVWLGYNDDSFKIIWQRETQSEALPFIDSEVHEAEISNFKIGSSHAHETLNDKVASAEAARQKFITPFDTQISGDHYKLLPIQPMKFCLANGLDYAQGNVIKYVIRHASKNGKDDLLKAIHNIELMIEHYYG